MLRSWLEHISANLCPNIWLMAWVTRLTTLLDVWYGQKFLAVDGELNKKNEPSFISKGAAHYFSNIVFYNVF